MKDPNVCLVKDIINKNLERGLRTKLEKAYTEMEMYGHSFNIPFICFGPKGGKQHAPDEYVDINSIYLTSEIYSQVIKKLFKLKQRGINYGNRTGNIRQRRTV